ncbi:MAG: cytochrome c oxidase accessory protein CcoG [Verrucomicrobiales bacterium]|nr:cytochrome c oxidase accessory protein CcoG [Verrucomicrobiales bacterium]
MKPKSDTAPASPSSPPARPTPDAADSTVLKSIDWTDFRDHLATADKQGRRMWLYPKKPRGPLYDLRTWVNFVLLAVMFAGPFVRIQGNPLLMMNIVERKFVILGQTFWPQDLPIFAIAMLIFLTGIVIFTAAFGRLWCGWTCPQTVLMEGVFRKIEYWIEGDSHQQRALSKAPWNFHKILRRGGKHVLFLALSFLIGNTLLSYIIGTEALFKIITDNPADHLKGLGFMVLFTLVFYGIFARFREQACTFICPYGRFQSTLLDENSIVVAYDHKRGEKRGFLRRKEPQDARKSSGHGDCVDCRQCVNVCPTGIDIRDGTQMECVNCTACIDACNAVMDKIGRPKGLIRYASLNGIERGLPLRFTPRLAGYATVLLALIGLFLYLLFTRSEIQTTLLRARGAELFQQMGNGRIANLYTVKLVNKTHHDIPVTLRLLDAPGELRVMGQQNLVIPAERLHETSVLIEMDPADLGGGNRNLQVGVFSGDRRIETLETVFIGPRTAPKPQP